MSANANPPFAKLLRWLPRRSRWLDLSLLLLLVMAATAGWYGPQILYKQQLGHAAELLGQLRFDEASKTIENLRRHRPTDPQPLLLLLSLQRQTDQLDDARATLAQLRAFNVPAQRLFDEENLLFARTADPNTSEARLSPLLTSDDFLPGDVCDAFATWLRGFSRLDAAQILIRTWKSDLPNDYRAWAQQGIVHAMLVQPAEAVNELRRAIELGDPRASTQAHLGRSLLDLDQLDKALEAFSLACERDPRSAENWMWKAKTLRLNGKIPECIQALQECIKLDPADFDASLMLALAERDHGQVENARARLSQFLTLWPDDQAALAAWIRILHADNNTSELQQAEARWKLASENVQRMESLLAQLQQEPTNNSIRCEAGCLAMKHQNRRAGEQLLFAVLRVEPGNQTARAALDDYQQKRNRILPKQP